VAAVSDQFRTNLARLLNERGVEVPDKEPPMFVVMQDLGLAGRYQIYAEASERQHGSLLGLEAHTQNLGNQRRYGEFAQWSDWLPPLHAAMGGIQVLARVFGRRTDTQTLIEAKNSAWSAWMRTLDRS
jgi:hypothetical protein